MGGLPTKKTIHAFAYSPKDPKIMYASLRNGLFLSKDEGNRWSLLEKSPREIVSIIIDPKDSSKIFVGTGEGKIFLTKDAGRSWDLKNR